MFHFLISPSNSLWKEDSWRFGKRLRRLNVSWYQRKFFGSMFCMHYECFTDLEGSSFHCMLGNWRSQEFKLLVLWGFPGCREGLFTERLQSDHRSTNYLPHSWSSKVETTCNLTFWPQCTLAFAFLYGENITNKQTNNHTTNEQTTITHWLGFLIGCTLMFAWPYQAPIHEYYTDHMCLNFCEKHV